MSASFPIRRIWPARAAGEPALLEIGGGLRAVVRLDPPMERTRLREGLTKAVEALPTLGVCELVVDVDEPAHRDLFLVFANSPASESDLDGLADALVRLLAQHPDKTKQLAEAELDVERTALLAQVREATTPLKAAGFAVTPLQEDDLLELLDGQVPSAPSAPGGEEPASLASLASLAAEEWQEEERAFTVDGSWTRTLYLHSFPTPARDGWLFDVLASFNRPHRLAVYLQKLDVGETLKSLRRQASHHEAALNKQAEEGLLVDSRRRARLDDLTILINTLETGATRPYRVSVYFTIFASDRGELDLGTALFERLWDDTATRQATFRHRQGFETTLPLLYNRLHSHSSARFMHTEGVATLFPFS